MQHEQAGLVDPPSGLCYPILHNALVCDRAAEGGAILGPRHHQVEGSFGHADRSHAVVDTAGPQTGLSDHVTGTFPRYESGRRNPHPVVADLGVSAAVVVAEHG